MKKLLLLDGNSMLFRAFYATIYTRPMKTSTNIPTNAIYAFALMLNKAIELIKPTHMLVAWDSGKPTFRHQLNNDYKGTRKQLPEELIAQFPIAREYLTAANIYQYQQDGIEADDIIGSISKQYQDYQVVILSSDKDLLQLIDTRINVMLMKKGMSEIQLIGEKELMEWMQIKPTQIIELKALMGDTADNIKGVNGIGEKTAIKLIQTYDNIENLYQNLDQLKGKQLENLTAGKESAFLSKTLATIITNEHIPLTEKNIALNINQNSLNQFYRKYEIKSLIKEVSVEATVDVQEVDKVDITKIDDNTIFSFHYDNEHYLEKSLYGVTIGNSNYAVYISKENLLKDEKLLKYIENQELITLNAKTVYHVLKNENIRFKEVKDDILLMSFLVDSSISDYEKMVLQFNLNIHEKHEDVFGKKGKVAFQSFDNHKHYFDTEIQNLLKIYPHIKQKIRDYTMDVLYEKIEKPLMHVLFKMERQGVFVDRKVLEDISEKTLMLIEKLSEDIYQLAGKTFNINSPKQLGEILFDELGLKSGKKKSTAIDVLEKLQHAHPIIPLIIQQRKYQKLYSTYAQGLIKHIMDDNKIHTTYNQLIAATGRLSSVDPNLQNISAKDEESKEIRKAFVASPNHSLLSFDYSQIELRIVAHMANETQMINSFNHNLDIHTATAQTIFNKEEVTDLERRFAKAVNFGILYGMSEFGLSQQLNISIKEAKQFIDKYYETYPNIQRFMHQQIAFCGENQYVETLFKRRRFVADINNTNKTLVEFAKRIAMNSPIQGTAADIIKLAMLKIDKLLENYQTKMILQVHDELVFDCPNEEKEVIYPLIQKAMSEVVSLKVKLESEGKFGNNYYETK